MISVAEQSTPLNLKDKNLRISLFGNPNYDQNPESQDINPGNNPRSSDLLTRVKFNHLDTTQRFWNKQGQVVKLPGTKEEIENIVKICKAEKLKPKVYTELIANEKNIKVLDNPDILHLATHGYFLENLPDSPNDRDGLMLLERDQYLANPLLRCGLLFAGAEKSLQGDKGNEEDGILTAQEAMSLYLDNTNLVVLSACETGLGEITNGEGVFGLQRAFSTSWCQDCSHVFMDSK